MVTSKLKKVGKIAVKVLSVGLFIFLALVNVQVIATTNGNGLDLAGVKLDVFMPSAVASGGGCDADQWSFCPTPHVWFCLQNLPCTWYKNRP